MFMSKGLFINTTILISFICVGSQLFRKIPVTPAGECKKKLIIGIGCGILGCILMIFSIMPVGTSIVLDLRQIAIVMVVILGGWMPSLITGLIISIFRLTYFGVNISSVYAVIIVMSIVIGCNVIRRFKYEKWKEWLLMNLYSLALINTLLLSILENGRDIKFMTIKYNIVSIIAGIITFFLVDYAIQSNDMIRRLNKEAKIDFLTGLSNVRQFDMELNKLMNISEEKKLNLSVIMIDIDHFKEVNDKYGHPNGDYILKQFAKVVEDSCYFKGHVFRTGGEEFLILLLDCSLNEGINIAERIRKNVEEHDFSLLDRSKVNITVSLGVSSYPSTSTDRKDLINQADEGLYKAKHSGRNAVGIVDKN